MPGEVYGHPQQHDDKPGPCRRRSIDEQHEQDATRARDVKRRQDRVTERTIRPLDVRPGVPQPEEPGDREDIEDQRGGDDVIEQVEPYLPEEKPRYLMGVGTPADLVECVAREPYHDSELVRHLLSRALANPDQLGQPLFWLLRSQCRYHTGRAPLSDAPLYYLLLQFAAAL